MILGSMKEFWERKNILLPCLKVEQEQGNKDKKGRLLKYWQIPLETDWQLHHQCTVHAGCICKLVVSRHVLETSYFSTPLKLKLPHSF